MNVDSGSMNLAAGSANLTAGSTNDQAPRAKEINSSLDATNILPEGVGRRRNQRKSAYAATLAEVHSLSSFHIAFSAYYTAASAYIQPKLTAVNLPSSSDIPSAMSTATARLHRDTLPSEPNNYTEIVRYPYAAGFKQAIAFKLITLRSKNI